jgi:Tfp pilus assembly protein PilO
VKKDVKLNFNFQKHGLIVVVPICGLLVLVLGWMVLLGPKQRQIGDLHQQATAVRQQIADDLARAAASRTAASAPTIKTADIYKLETAMPSILDMPDLLLELDQMAKSSGVTLMSIGPSPLSQGTSGYSTEKLSLLADGNFYTLTDYIYRLRNMVYVRGGALEANGRIFTLDNVAITPGGSAAGGLQAQIQLETYVYGAPPGAPAGVAATPSSTTPASTTSTTTTTTSSSGPSAAGATP